MPRHVSEWHKLVNLIHLPASWQGSPRLSCGLLARKSHSPATQGGRGLADGILAPKRGTGDSTQDFSTLPEILYCQSDAMLVRILTSRYSSELQGFPDEAVRSFCANHQVLEARSYRRATETPASLLAGESDFLAKSRAEHTRPPPARLAGESDSLAKQLWRVP